MDEVSSRAMMGEYILYYHGNGQVLKSMKFKFPVFYNGQTIEGIRWDKENTVETVVLMSRADK
ncbi:MAG: hypothetical protein IJQ21_01485 [Lachnospiraceae bacterium]|nr:hypothetical protein [Lachnospiraceae bacterium]